LLQFDSIFGNDFVQSYFDETVCVPQGKVQAEKPLSYKQTDISIDIIPCKRIYQLISFQQPFAIKNSYEVSSNLI